MSTDDSTLISVPADTEAENRAVLLLDAAIKLDLPPSVVQTNTEYGLAFHAPKGVVDKAFGDHNFQPVDEPVDPTEAATEQSTDYVSAEDQKTLAASTAKALDASDPQTTGDPDPQAQATDVDSKPVTEKPVAKRAPAKRAPAKKTTAKKTAAKKTTAAKATTTEKG